MEIENQNIDFGKAFGWGRTPAEYARHRDIYPKVFYEKIVERNLCVKGQKVLDLGAGIGVLPRNMYAYGADWVGTDTSENQIEQVKELVGELGQETEYLVVATEDVDYPDGTFDVITACQCSWHFDHEGVMPKLARISKPDGRSLLLHTAWLPYEDDIVGESEKLVLKYSPNRSGVGETIHPIHVSSCVHEIFESVHHEEYEIEVSFTKGTWNGRMEPRRSVETSLPPEEVEQQEWGHRAMLERIAPEEFTVKHYVAMLELKRK